MSNKFSFRRYLSIRVLPIWAILLFDVFIVAISCLAAYVLRYNLSLVLANIEHIDIAVLWCVGVNLVFFKLFKTYSGVLRYSSFVDIIDDAADCDEQFWQSRTAGMQSVAGSVYVQFRADGYFACDSEAAVRIVECGL